MNKAEQTLSIIKPDAVERNLTEKIKAIPDVPSTVKVQGLFQVRGELFNPSEYERPTYSQRQVG